MALHQLKEDIDQARWTIRELQPGESTVYYEGYILRDRIKPIVAQLADEVWARARAGELLLTQRRLGPPVRKTKKRGEIIAEIDHIVGAGSFAYIATRRRTAEVRS